MYISDKDFVNKLLENTKNGNLSWEPLIFESGSKNKSFRCTFVGGDYIEISTFKYLDLSQTGDWETAFGIVLYFMNSKDYCYKSIKARKDDKFFDELSHLYDIIESFDNDFYDKAEKFFGIKG